MSENWEITHTDKGNTANITFINVSTGTIKALQGLSKSALRASGKEIRKILRDGLPKHSGRLKNHIASWAFIGKNDGIPQLQVGFYGWQRVRKRGAKPSHANPHWVEFGTKAHQITVRIRKNARFADEQPQILGNNGYFYAKTVQHPGQKGQHILRNTVYDNIDRIRAAQEEYLKQLNEDIDILTGKIEESEDVEDD